MAKLDTDDVFSVRVSSFRPLRMALIISLIGVVFVVFRGVLGHEFVHYDDSLNIYDNQNVSGLSWKNIQWMLTDTSYAPRYMPLGWMCYALDRQLFGLNSQIWHAGNLLVHLLNTLLLFFLLKELISLAANKHDPMERETVSNWCAAIGALFWAVNPLRVETVAWASARIYGVAVLFALVWLLAWLRAQSAQTPRQRRCYSWLALGAFTASLLTYPLAIFASVLLLAFDVFPLRRAPLKLTGWLQGEGWKLWREKIPFFLVTAAILVVTVGARMGADPRFRPPTLAEFGALDRVMQACYVLTYYVWKPWEPFQLSAAYPTLHAFNPLGWKFLASAAFVVVTTIITLGSYRRWPILLAIWICHGLILLPVLGLSEYPHSAFDRYSLLHGILWSAVIAGGLYAIWDRERGRQIVGGTLVAVSAVFAFFSVSQIPAWKNTVAIYNSIVDRFGEHPGRGRFDEVLGVFYLRAGQTNKAIESLTAAVYYDSRRTDRHAYVEKIIPRCELRLAEICVGKGDWPSAAAHIQAALQAERDPVYIVTLAFKLSAALAKCSRDTEALPWLKKAAEIAPENAALHRELGMVLQKLGSDTESRRHFEEERRLKAAEERLTARRS
ncbi:MAG TPA: hypothetical protein VNT99_02780 [Methylomirabilota bacterium]|nr:hypothetical protein [Methylomirabilota bacterium]